MKAGDGVRSAGNLQFMQFMQVWGLILKIWYRDLFPRVDLQVSPTCCASSFYYFILQCVQQFQGCEKDRKIKNSSLRICFSSVAALLRFKHNQRARLIVFINVLQYCGICRGKKKGKEPDHLQKQRRLTARSKADRLERSSNENKTNEDVVWNMTENGKK